MRGKNLPVPYPAFLLLHHLGRNISRLYLMTNQAGNPFIELGETIFQARGMPPELKESFKKLGEEFPHVWEGKNKVENGGCRHENRL